MPPPIQTKPSTLKTKYGLLCIYSNGEIVSKFKTRVLSEKKSWELDYLQVRSKGDSVWDIIQRLRSTKVNLARQEHNSSTNNLNDLNPSRLNIIYEKHMVKESVDDGFHDETTDFEFNLANLNTLMSQLQHWAKEYQNHMTLICNRYDYFQPFNTNPTTHPPLDITQRYLLQFNALLIQSLKTLDSQDYSPLADFCISNNIDRISAYEYLYHRFYTHATTILVLQMMKTAVEWYLVSHDVEVEALERVLGELRDMFREPAGLIVKVYWIVQVLELEIFMDGGVFPGIRDKERVIIEPTLGNYE